MLKFPSPETELDEPIDNLLNEMSTMNSDTEEYDRALRRLETLYNLRDRNRPERVSRDTMALVLGNLAGIGIIVGYERMNVLASRAINFVVKPKLS
jgi:hypothetical protein